MVPAGSGVIRMRFWLGFGALKLSFCLLTSGKTLVVSRFLDRSLDENVFAQKQSCSAKMASARCRWRSPWTPGQPGGSNPARENETDIYATSGHRGLRGSHQCRESSPHWEEGNRKGIHDLFRLERRREIHERRPGPRASSREVDHPRRAGDDSEKPPRS